MNAPPLPCPVCGGRRGRPCLDIPDVPVACNVLWPTARAARAAPRGDLRLCFCPDCAHVHNAAFDPARLDYDADYENSLHFSPRFQAYAETLADRLIARHGLRGRDIVEIACGKGDFLRLLCARGGNRGHGFDPSYPSGPDREAIGGGIRYRREYFDPARLETAADLIVCRHALEHMPRPTEFLTRLRAGLRAGLTTGGGTALFFEVPNAMHSLRDLGVWDFIYEHPQYFTGHSLAQAFALAGFAVERVEAAFGGQYLCLHARPAPAGDPADGERTDSERTTAGAAAGAAARPAGGQAGDDPRADDPAVVAGFAERLGEVYAAKVAHWRARLAELAAAGRTAAVWGAGSKGITFLNVLPAAGVITRVVDVNPRKQGRFVPGPGLPVVAPAELAARPPDLVVVVNPLYREEIAGMLAAAGVSAELAEV